MVQVVVPFAPGAPSGRFTGRTGLERELTLSTECERIDVLYRTYARRLRSLCARRLGKPDDADDAVHETVLKAARAWPSFRPGSDPWPWIGTIATNVCCDLQRARARQDGTGIPDRVVDVDAAVVSSITSELVHGALGELSEPIRSTLILREIEGWSYDEIAALQGRSLAAVRSTIMRGRRTIRTSLRQLADAGRLPLPAGAPILWRRLRASASRRSASVLSVDPSVAYGMGSPARAALFAAVLAIGTSGLFAASSSEPALAGSGPAGGRSLQVQVLVAGTPEPAGVTARGTEAANHPAGSRPGERLASVSIAPSGDGASEGLTASAGLTGPSDAGTLDGKVAGRAPSVGDIEDRERLNVDCDYSEVRQRACDAVDAAPRQP